MASLPQLPCSPLPLLESMMALLPTDSKLNGDRQLPVATSARVHRVIVQLADDASRARRVAPKLFADEVSRGNG